MAMLIRYDGVAGQTKSVSLKKRRKAGLFFNSTVPARNDKIV